MKIYKENVKVKRVVEIVYIVYNLYTACNWRNGNGITKINNK